MRLLTYNDLVDKYIFNNQICKYNIKKNIVNHRQHFNFRCRQDVDDFVKYYHFKNHDFGDLSLGDSIIINDGKYNKMWLIAGFDTQLDSDVNNGSYGKSHITLITEHYLSDTMKMDCRDNNTTGFAGTELFNQRLTEVDEHMAVILNNHLLTHKTVVSTSNYSGVKSCDVKSMLMSYNQVFGDTLPYISYWFTQQYMASSKCYINGYYDMGDDICQLPLFHYDVKKRNVSGFWWLRNTYLEGYFSGVDSFGQSACGVPCSAEMYTLFRPFICLG